MPMWAREMRPVPKGYITISESYRNVTSTSFRRIAGNVKGGL